MSPASSSASRGPLLSPPTIISLVSLLTTLSAILLFPDPRPTASSSRRSCSSNASLTSPAAQNGLADLYPLVPHAASWGSWWHAGLNSQFPVGGEKGHENGKSGRGDRGQAACRSRRGGLGHDGDIDGVNGNWNILYHLGGNGPWVERVDDVVEGGIAVPVGCKVEQVHMIARHGERYPTTRVGIRMVKLLQRIKDSNVTLQGDLSFLNSWEFFAPDPQSNFNQLTTTGPYAGTLSAFTTGVKLRSRYGHLIPQPSSGSRTRAPFENDSQQPLTSEVSGALPKIKVWASGSQRVIETADYFSAGFFGLERASITDLQIIPETVERGSDTLTPGKACPAYLADGARGHSNGIAKLLEFRSTYLGEIGDRLGQQNEANGIKFTDDEVYAMQEMCGFEIMVRGRSPWCDVFTKDEWMKFEYARDVFHFYKAGPGTGRYADTMGWGWLNATATLLGDESSTGGLFFSFVHDGDLSPILSLLGLFHDRDENDNTIPLPVTGAVPQQRKWRTSQQTPMGARLILERMRCLGDSSNEHDQQGFVRINLNDGIVPIPECEYGPGRSCPLNRFVEWVRKKGERVDDFGEVCGLAKGSFPAGISFLQHTSQQTDRQRIIKG